MFFEKNMQALITTDPVHENLRIQLQNAPELQEDEYEFYETEDGHYTLKFQGIFLHDLKRPIDEIHEAFAKQCTAANDQVHFVLGLGLGYSVQETLKLSPGAIVVYEPHLSLLRFILENIDLSESFNTRRVWVAGTQFDAIQALTYRIYSGREMDVLSLNSYAYLLSKTLPALLDRMWEMSTDVVQDIRTGNYFHFKWIEQFFSNYPYFSQIKNLDELVNRFGGKPALVVSRGPSLDAALDSISALKDSTVIIAVGGALRALSEAGIVPDVALFYDANGMQEQLNGIPQEVIENTTFLLSPFTHKCCYETPSRGKMIFLGQNNYHFSEFLDRALEHSQHRVEGGGTVSLIAFETAVSMGCNPIILVGQDLAMPNNQVYAGGIELTRDEQGRMDLKPSETLYAKPTAMTEVPGQHGEMLPTLKTFISFLRHFEDLAIKNSRKPEPVKLYNASLGGAHIEGYELRNLAEFIGEFPAWKNGEFALSEIPSTSESEFDTRRKKLIRGIQKLRQDIKNARRLCKSLEAQVAKMPMLTLQPQHCSNQLRALSKELYDFAQKNTFVGYTILFELLKFKRKYKAASSLSEIQRLESIQEALSVLLTSCQTVWQEQINPWLEQAEVRLQKARYQGPHTPADIPPIEAPSPEEAGVH